MQPILAESLDGWLIGAAALVGGLVAALLALVALVPAWRGNRPVTFMLTVPAFIVGVMVTLWLGYGYVTDGLRDPDYSMSDFIMPWLVMAGPSLVMGFAAVLVLWFRRRAQDG